MIGIILAIAILIFGIFLKSTNDPKLESFKKFSWMFIIIGILTLAGKLVIMYQNGELK